MQHDYGTSRGRPPRQTGKDSTARQPVVDGPVSPPFFSPGPRARADMAYSMSGLSTYELVRVDTGVALYSTVATHDEIIRANLNLRNRNVPSRFFLLGTFRMPNLHDPSSPFCTAG